jgi:hypothetical protein
MVTLPDVVRSRRDEDRARRDLRPHRADLRLRQSMTPSTTSATTRSDARAWGLAAKFEGDRDEILARSLHHGSPYNGAPSEDEVIERQGGECCAVAADHGDLFFGEELAEHRREHNVRRRCELRRFEHDAVSRGDRGDHGHQRQVDGIVHGEMTPTTPSG